MKLRVEVAVSEKMEDFMLSVEKFQKLFENAPIPYVILEGKGRIKDLNKAALRFFHGTNEDMLMADLFSFVSPENAIDASQLAKYYELRTPIDKRQVRMVTRKAIPAGSSFLFLHFTILITPFRTCIYPRYH